jgi:hypothetical protein
MLACNTVSTIQSAERRYPHVAQISSVDEGEKVQDCQHGSQSNIETPTYPSKPFRVLVEVPFKGLLYWKVTGNIAAVVDLLDLRTFSVAFDVLGLPFGRPAVKSSAVEAGLGRHVDTELGIGFEEILDKQPNVLREWSRSSGNHPQ